MAKTTLHLFHPLTQCYKKGNFLSNTPPHKNDTQHKSTSQNDVSQKCHSRTYIIGFLKCYQPPAYRTYSSTIRHRRVIVISLWIGKNSSLKSHNHESESYNKFKNSLLKITQLNSWQMTFGHFFARDAIFMRHHFFSKPYLSISVEIFVVCHFCKVSLFSNDIKGCLFCWVLFFLSVSDSATFAFYSYVHKECSPGSANCNYLLFYQ